MKSSALLPSNAECHQPIKFITEPLYSNNDPTNIFFVKEWKQEIHTAYCS